MMGAEAGRVEGVEMLVNRGVDIEHTDNDGWTALIEAAYNARINTVNILLKHKADPSAISRIKTDRGNNMDAVRWTLEWNGDMGLLW